ncbi:MAG: PadR family transcriptional regulator [Dehalococcoidia bacterium]|jgi:DNA-binding PadR family transcriptional regulator|nr:PadR family transcriptional regulator [Dehalococcoidia bacterium]
MVARRPPPRSQPKPLPKSGYLILGLLSLGEMSGYELKQQADMSVALFYASPARSQIYTELRRLSELGYATEREVEQTDRPDKRLYSITESGEAALRDWLENTPTSADVIKSHLLLKVFFGSRMDRSMLIDEVRRYRDDSLSFRARLEEILIQGAGEPDSLFLYLTIGQGISHTRADEVWASEALRLLAGADEEFIWSNDQGLSAFADIYPENQESSAR